MFAKELSQATVARNPNYTLIMVGVLGLVFSPTLVVWLFTVLSSH